MAGGPAESYLGLVMFVGLLRVSGDMPSSAPGASGMSADGGMRRAAHPDERPKSALNKNHCQDKLSGGKACRARKRWTRAILAVTSSQVPSECEARQSKAPTRIWAEKVAAFAKVYPHNTRPTQPLDGRELLESQ